VERKIRKMNVFDVNKVVEIHLNSFKGFFLTELGSAFLRVLYRYILFESKSIGFVSECDGRLVGFVVGTTDVVGFYRRALVKKWLAFGIASIPAIVKNPSVFFRVVRAIMKPKEEDERGFECELMSIAVDPLESGFGHGRGLIDAFSSEAFKRGCFTIGLTTDKAGNDRVNEFYRKSGFIARSSYTTPEGREMNVYVKERDRCRDKEPV
jgi:GNAT superfamily N-acetyltransferase